MANRSRTTILVAIAAALLLPSLGAAQDGVSVIVPPETAPTIATAPAAVPAATTAPTTLPTIMIAEPAAGPLATARAVGLRYAFADSSTAPAMHRKLGSRSSVSLMVFGLATLLVGTVVDGDAGTVIVLTGAGIGLVGLYRYLNP